MKAQIERKTSLKNTKREILGTTMQCLVAATVVALILSSVALISFFVLQEDQDNGGSYPTDYKLVLDEPEEIPKVSRNYSFGFKTPGEQLVGFGSNSYEFRNFTNAQTTVQWPTGNIKEDTTFTYLAVYTNQTSTFGNALVMIDGTYNSPSIVFAVQANNTLLFEYKYEMYALDRSKDKN